MAQRWVLLARQEGAIDAPAPAPRVEAGPDLWVEALSGLRPAPVRDLVKHLLNLFALLATAAGALSETDVERLARAAARSLFGAQTLARDREDGPARALAFLIGKRAEYLACLHSVGQGLARARESAMFLPSTTHECLEWKAGW